MNLKFITHIKQNRDGYSVSASNGKKLRKINGRVLVLNSKDLAISLAEAWQDGGPKLIPESIPLINLAINAEEISLNKEYIITNCLVYASTDTVCYREENDESGLVETQKYCWDPLLHWLKKTFGVILVVTTGVIPIDQPEKSLKILRNILNDCTSDELACIYFIAKSSGSLVIALAFIKGRINSKQSLEASCLDLQFQAKKWGFDSEIEHNINQQLDDLLIVEKYLDAC